MNINKIQVAGNLTKQPEMRTTQTGIAVMSFSLAVNRVWKDKQGNKQEEVEFINCVAWARTAEVINQYAIKGQNLFIEGTLKTSNYQDKTGITRYKTEVIVSEMQFGQKPKGAVAPAQEVAATAPLGTPDTTAAQIPKDEIPVIQDEPSTTGSAPLQSDDIDPKKIPF